MPTQIAYTTEAIIYTPRSNSWGVRPDFDPRLHRFEIELPDQKRDQAHDQIVTTGAADRSLFFDEYYELEGPGGEIIYIDRLEIDGVLAGYTATAPLQQGVSYRLLGTYNSRDETCDDYAFLSDMHCFGSDTMVATDYGDVPISRLSRGDKILTRDHGYQPLRWVGRLTLPRLLMRKKPRFAPVSIRADLFGMGANNGYLETSPAHRILLAGADVQLLFGEDEVFVDAKCLADPKLPALTARNYVYHQLLFHRHQVVLANGIWSESLHIAPPSLGADAITGTCPPRGIYHGQSARPCLTADQASLLVKLRLAGQKDCRKQSA